MGVQRKQQPLIARAVAQPLHHREEGGETEAEPAILRWHRHPENAERGARLPAGAIERLGLVRVDPTAAKARSGEFDRTALQFFLMGVEFEVHCRAC